jgi:hypothetical protein
VRRALVRAPALSTRRLIAVLAVALATVPVVVYLWLAGHRIGYPYELDWLEGGTVELVNRVLGGHGLYSPPTLSYVGFTYTPLYSFLSAALAEVLGVGFLPLRIVSFVSSLAVMGLLAAYVRDMSGDWVAGAVAAGIFAACYRLSGNFFDVGRLDSLFLALALAALWLGRRAGSVRAGIGVGVIAFLAFFTKQVGLIVIGPALVVALGSRPRVALAALGTLIVLAGSSTLILDAATDNWYRYYVLSELTGQPVVTAQYRKFWHIELYANLRQLTWLAVLGLVAAVPFRRPRPSRAELGMAVYDLAAALGLLIAAWISIIHSGGWFNVLMPAYAAAAGIGGWAFAVLRRRGWLLGLVAVGLLAWNFTWLLRDAGVALPTHADRVGGGELIAALKRLPGPVLVLRHPWYGTQAGKGSFAQSDGITEVLRSKGARGAVDLRRDLRDALNRYHVRAVVLDGPAPAWLAPQLTAEFRRVPGTLTATPVRPPRDIRSSPEYLYLRRSR